MTLKIISAEQIIFTGSVAGTVRYVDETGKESSLSVEGGIADVDNNVISVCIY